MSESEIIKGVIDKNPIAERKLHDKYERFMWYLAMRIVKNPMDADDIVQEAFIKIFKSIASKSEEGSLKSWIGQIVWNTALTHYGSTRRERYSIDIEDYMLMEKGKYSFEDKFMASDQIKMAMKILQKTRPTQYTCFRLHYIEDMDHKEIATDIGISEGTSKSNCFRGAERIKEIIIHFNKNGQKLRESA